MCTFTTMVRAEFSGNTILSGNSADYGGGIYASSNASSNSVGTPSSVVIWVTCWGALHVDSNNNMQFIGNTTFSGNSGHYGGTMDIGMNSSTNFSGNINFSGNSSSHCCKAGLLRWEPAARMWKSFHGCYLKGGAWMTIRTSLLTRKGGERWRSTLCMFWRWLQ